MVKNVGKHFLYFAYGTNLLKQKIHLYNPASVYVGVAQLANHQLNFARFDRNWQGAVATIVPKQDEAVWGAIWIVHNKDLESLDKQEGVADNQYIATTVNVKTTKGEDVIARTYIHTFIPPVWKQGENLPAERRPSDTYKLCIVRGALECNLPKIYVTKLVKIPSNGQFAAPAIRSLLNL